MNFLKSTLSSSPFNFSLAMMIVGSAVICGKLLSQELPLFLTSELRFLLSALLFVPFGIYNKSLFRICSHDWLILVIMALCGQVIFTVLLLFGLRYTSGVTAGTLTSTTPLFMAITAYFFLHEHYSIKQLISFLISIASIVVLGFDTFLTLGDTQGYHLLGNILVLGAVMGESCFLLLGKKLKTDISGIKLTSILSLLGSILCLPPAVLEFSTHGSFSLTAPDLLVMLYLGWIYTNLAYICWFHGLKHSSGANAGLYTAIMPISASFYSLWLIHEHMNHFQVIALVLAVSSIMIANLHSGRSNYE